MNRLPEDKKEVNVKNFVVEDSASDATKVEFRRRAFDSACRSVQRASKFVVLCVRSDGCMDIHTLTDRPGIDKEEILRIVDNGREHIERNT